MLDTDRETSIFVQRLATFLEDHRDLTDIGPDVLLEILMACMRCPEGAEELHSFVKDNRDVIPMALSRSSIERAINLAEYMRSSKELEPDGPPTKVESKNHGL
jgi:hypothetical protein